MPKNITFEWFTVTTMQINIQVTKKHSISLLIKERGLPETEGIYPPSLEILLGGKPVTDVYIKGRTPDKQIAPTAENLRTAIELIEEAEYRMAERRKDANESITDEE